MCPYQRLWGILDFVGWNFIPEVPAEARNRGRQLQLGPQVVHRQLYGALPYTSHHAKDLPGALCSTAHAETSPGE